MPIGGLQSGSDSVLCGLELEYSRVSLPHLALIYLKLYNEFAILLFRGVLLNKILNKIRW